MTIRVGKYRGGGFEVDIRVRLPDGTRYRERTRSPVTSKSGSMRWAEARSLELATHGRPTKKEVPTLAQFESRYIEWCTAKRLKPSTIIQKQQIFRHYLVPMVGQEQIDAIGNAAVAKMMATLAPKHPKTVNNIFTVLNGCFKLALSWGLIDRMPATVEMLKVPPSTMSFYEPHEYERLVDAALKIDARIYLFVLLAGEAGLRCGEIIALEQSDVDLRRGVITVCRSEWEGHLTAPKSGRSRKVVLTERLKAALSRNRHLRGDRVLWRDDGFEKVSQVLLAKWMRRVQRKAGLKVTGGIHILRHTFCTRLAMAGASTMAIKELAGHQQISTTQKYMHLAPAAKSVAIALLDKGADLAASGPSEAEQKALADVEVRGDGGETQLV